jgi:hypothetical protein
MIVSVILPLSNQAVGRILQTQFTVSRRRSGCAHARVTQAECVVVRCSRSRRGSR